MTSRIAQRLGIRPPVGRAGNAQLRLAGDTLRFVADDGVRGEGRLVLVPGRGRTGRGGEDSDGDLCVLGLGWATVDTERSATEFVKALDLPGTATSVDRDRLIGAYAHQLVDERFPGGRLVILEPSTEGRLAATLARHGVMNGAFMKGEGCGHCRGTGYKGRRAVAELLRLDDGLRDLIAARAPMSEIKAAARARGMKSLREMALAAVCRGETTFEELERVTLDE